MIIKRNETEYIKVIKKHKLICSECGSEDVQFEDLRRRHNMACYTRPIILECGYCGHTSQISDEEHRKLRNGLIEERLVEYSGV